MYSCPVCGHERCVVVDSVFCLENQVKRLKQERDEARAYAEERNDEANKLQLYLNMAAAERDEARVEIGRLRGLLSICEEAFEVIGDSNHSRAHATAAAMLAELAPEVESWTNDR